MTLTNEQRIRELELRSELDHHLNDLLPNKYARNFLLDEIVNAPSGKAHVIGTAEAPELDELADECWATEQGQNLREVLAESEAAEAAANETERDRKLAEINAIENPGRRINAARKAGFA